MKLKLPRLILVGCLSASAIAVASDAPIIPRAAALTPGAVKPDLVVAADGSGDFKTVQEAVASIPRTNRERLVVYIKNGLYHEKVRIDPAFVTLHGETRADTRIEFAQPANGPRDTLGQAVVNVNGDDCVLENLTIENTHGVIGVHAFAIYGRGDRTVIQDANVWSQGNDTLSLWRTGSGQFSEEANAHSSPNGRYFHARLDVCGSVDFICPRGTCYIVDSNIHEVKAQTEAVWHDGSRDQAMKFVLRDCHFDGPQDWRLARHHHDAQFYFIDCLFSATLLDRQPKRVIYPLNGGPPSEADLQNNREHDPTNIWGERTYYYNTHRDGGDYAWMKENLAEAPGSPKSEKITTAWTFDGKWDPENKAGPEIRTVAPKDGKMAVTFSENVTVKGKPRVILRGGSLADYASGSGTDTLLFVLPAGSPGMAEKIDLQGGAVVATEAAATLRRASLKLP